LTVGRKWKRSVSKRKGKQHDQKIEEFFEHPEKMGIEELKKGKVVYREAFPRDKYNNEVGDLIIVSEHQKKFKIFIIELTLGKRGSKIMTDRKKLRKSEEYFRNPVNAKNFFSKRFKQMGEKIEYVAKGVIVLYVEAKLLNEKPYIEEVFKIKSAC